MDPRPLVLGAGGFLGLNFIDALHDADIAPICGTRRKSPRVALRRRRVDTVHADLDQPDSLREAMRGRSVVYHFAAHYPDLSVDRAHTLAVGMRQVTRVLDSAAAAGVERLVYVSSTATVAPAPSGPSNESHTYPAAPGHGVYHDLKWHMEQAVLDESRLRTVVALPGGCLGPWDMRIGTSALLVALARSMEPVLPDGMVNLVDVRDVATGVLVLGTHPAPPRRVIFVAEDHRLMTLMRELAARYRVPEPRWLPPDRAIARADAEESRAAREGGRAMLSREIVDLILNGVPTDNTLSRTALGLAYRPLHATLDDYDAWARKRRIIPRNPESQHD